MFSSLYAFNLVDQIWEQLEDCPIIFDDAHLVPCFGGLGPEEYLYVIQKNKFGNKSKTQIARIEVNTFLYNQWEVIDLDLPTWVHASGTVDAAYSIGTVIHLIMGSYHLIVDTNSSELKTQYYQEEKI